MTDKEQIIIDGVDVSGCGHLEDKEACGSMDCQSIECEKNQDCYYKQLARKEQECEELKERLVRTEEDLKYQCVDCMNVKFDRYRKALEEIKEILEIHKDNKCAICPKFDECFEHPSCDNIILQKISKIENESK